LPGFTHGGQQTELNQTLQHFGSEPDLQMHVTNLKGSPPSKRRGGKNWLFCDGSHLDKTISDDENRAVFTYLQ